MSRKTSVCLCRPATPPVPGSHPDRHWHPFLPPFLHPYTPARSTPARPPLCPPHHSCCSPGIRPSPLSPGSCRKQRRLPRSPAHDPHPDRLPHILPGPPAYAGICLRPFHRRSSPVPVHRPPACPHRLQTHRVKHSDRDLNNPPFSVIPGRY